MLWIGIALLVGCALSCAQAVWSMVRAERARAACVELQAGLSQQRGRIIGLEHALEKLHAQHRSLVGKMHADRRWQAEAQQDAVSNDDTVCENYRAAQLEGPFSQAASCPCEYCERMRTERAGRRAAARATLPRGATKQ